jgi:YD repeat-containing protein
VIIRGEGLAHTQLTSYSFDALNRLTAMTDALSNKTTYAFDAVGNETALTDGSSNVVILAEIMAPKT